MRARGFTLVELTIVLVILALLAGSLFGLTSTMMNIQRGETTRAKLKVIDAALVSFVAINRRLPCPANGTLMTGGEELVAAQCNNQATGVVPWSVLGLSASDIEDGWGTRITYRTDRYLTLTGSGGHPNPMDMSLCDPAGTMLIASAPRDTTTTQITCGMAGSCVATNLSLCVSPTLFLPGKGLEVRDALGGTVLMNPATNTGAAYVLISHGENRSGGYNDIGMILAATIAVEGTNETQNRADTSPGYYVDAPQIFAADATRFDDYVLRPSLISVIQRAHLGPRSH
jgi:prepilin-type N-terminal cleavage/methylation domain-containing protein